MYYMCMLHNRDKVKWCMLHEKPELPNCLSCFWTIYISLQVYHLKRLNAVLLYICTLLLHTWPSNLWQNFGIIPPEKLYNLSNHECKNFPHWKQKSTHTILYSFQHTSLKLGLKQIHWLSDHCYPHWTINLV